MDSLERSSDKDIATTRTPLLVDATVVAELLGISPRTVWRLLSAGKLPKPVRLGRSVRWRKRLVEDWVSQGCPQPGYRFGVPKDQRK